MSVDRKVASAGMRLLMMALVSGFLLFAVVGWDVISTQMAKAEAERQLEEQKQIATELEAVMKEQKELETKINNIDARINAIKKLREEQKGPSAVLEALRERIAMVPGLYLQSVEQSGDQVTIKGNSPDEAAVTQFGRSLEFSGGLFSNLNIETQRQEMVNQAVSAAASGGEAPKVEIVNFTIRAGYNSSKGNMPTTVAENGQAPAAPTQVAKN
jgi:Tfp pilus assembly protein PilN